VFLGHLRVGEEGLEHFGGWLPILGHFYLFLNCETLKFEFNFLDRNYILILYKNFILILKLYLNLLSYLNLKTNS